MSITRGPDESFDDFKKRQRAESNRAKIIPYLCRPVNDNYAVFPNNQIITEEGITRGRARSMKYKAKAIANQQLSNTKKKKL